MGTLAKHPVMQWFETQVGRPFPFQRQCWADQTEQGSGLIHAPTGLGKTMAAALPSLIEVHDAVLGGIGLAGQRPTLGPGPKLVWVTPLRALASDTQASLSEPLEALGIGGAVERRTGDVASSVKARQKKRYPPVLVTTPESLTLLMSYSDSPHRLRRIGAVVVDEWHELLSSKRGTQTELALARLRQWNPGLRVWGLSATLANLPQAMQALMGAGPLAPQGRLITGHAEKAIHLDTIAPEDVTRFPWSGHMGLHLLEPVLEVLEQAGSTLLFTNTRNQAEVWYQAILKRRPDWMDAIALHHGSLDKAQRQIVEDRLRAGTLRAVVCTSSLDLGVDFSPVERVIQVASPKGVARLMQRAGRSGHGPGRVSHAVGVPTNALELLDFAAARDAMQRGDIEAREPLSMPLDVLAQHVVTCAMGGGLDRPALLRELQSTYAYRELTDEQLGWVLDFAVRGGPTLTAYPRFCRIREEPEGSGRFVVASSAVSRAHRLGVGTITSDAAIAVRFVNGKTLGTVEESFVGMIKPGDRFVFAGHLLQLQRVRQMTAWVRKAKGRKAEVPRWQGGRSPLSTRLTASLRRCLSEFAENPSAVDPQNQPELAAVAPLLRLQQEVSRLPGEGALVIERLKTRDGHHAFLYPLQGRLVHEGLGALLAHRLSRAEPRSLTVTVNDYGLELLSPQPLPSDTSIWRDALGTQELVEDLLTCVDMGQLARRQFRDIARIAGLIAPDYPGSGGQSSRQVQASSELFFDVFSEFDPDNLLLTQAKREVLNQQLDVKRLRGALEALLTQGFSIQPTDRLSPLAFPIWAERLRQQHVTTESWESRVRAMSAQLEAWVDAGGSN